MQLFSISTDSIAFEKWFEFFCYISSFSKLNNKTTRSFHSKCCRNSFCFHQTFTTHSILRTARLNCPVHSQDILPKSNFYKILAPFLYPTTKLIRVGGRLSRGDFSQLKNYPVLISKDSIFAKMLIVDAYFDTLHGGVDLVLNTIRQKY